MKRNLAFVLSPSKILTNPTGAAPAACSHPAFSFHHLCRVLQPSPAEPVHPIPQHLASWGFTSAQLHTLPSLALLMTGTFLMTDVLVFQGRWLSLKGIQPWVTANMELQEGRAGRDCRRANLIHPSPQGRIKYSYVTCGRYLSALFLKASSDGDPTVSPGCLSPCSNSPYY